jgi:hypothetical protein
MNIVICASIEFTPKILEVKAELEKLGHLVEIPLFSQKIAQGELTTPEFIKNKETAGGDIKMRQAQSADLIQRYWNLIKSADAILVLNLEKKGIANYIGGSVLLEMGFAYGHGKKIFLYNPLPQKSERIHYLDELIDLKPIIINGDLNMLKLIN